jgi:hypothetical protein
MKSLWYEVMAVKGDQHFQVDLALPSGEKTPMIADIEVAKNLAISLAQKGNVDEVYIVRREVVKRLSGKFRKVGDEIESNGSAHQ